ncbi:flagellar protein FliT [Billgrantia kenyensis]|uniref:Flagellar protein FliT n=1 Tax=Billgrantia kenyensis TaxID=321266 RepID=A0A7V9W0M6_9GAMM|nr:flagellar protein FliT [Halomonas kenyensis]MBA2778867.1 flagellar protein FliT [Halomonas kenyensis]MCG6662794.1 flagellar protein FliT [Halomonas kenyensis]
MAMTTARAVLEGYAQLRQQVAIMLELARAGEWDTLIERQGGYLQLADRLRQLDKEVELDQDGIQCKAELLEAILADDLAIQEYLMARRSELGQLMGTSRRQRDLHRSYGKQATVVVDAGDKFDPGTP